MNNRFEAIAGSKERFDPTVQGRRYKNKSFRRVYSNYPGQFYFADLVDWSKKEGVTADAWRKANKGYTYILVVIDAFSRYVWMRNIKNKTAYEVQGGFESIFDQEIFNIAGKIDEITLPEKVQNIPKHMCTDAGTEFTSNEMKTYWEHNGITHIIMSGDSKAMLAERVIQDYKMFLRNRWDGKNWYEWTDKFVEFYNHKRHSIIKQTPYDVFINGKYPSSNKSNLKTKKQDDLQIGDRVVLRINKKLLDKKSLKDNWGDLVYTIAEKDSRYHPYMYRIKNDEGELFEKRYYGHELLKVD